MKKSYLSPIKNINVLNEKGDINVSYKAVYDAGYCNACTNRNITYVYEVTLKSLSFCLCTKCKDRLLENL